MRQARGAPEPTNDLRNRAMEVALAKAGVKPHSEPIQQATADTTTKIKQDNPGPKTPKKASSVTAQSPRTHHQKLCLTADEKAKAKHAQRQKREAKEAAKRRSAARRQAAAAEAARLEKERREAERLTAIEVYIRDIESARFGDLIGNWRRHVEFVDYIRRTGINRHRLELYERLVRSIEIEWKRRSNLRHVTDEYFDWPTTDAKRGKGAIDDLSWVEKGVLGYLGYNVGEKSTLTVAHRHAILRRVFHMHLPPIESPAYMADWAERQSAARLKKMANSLASFARQAKRQSSRDMSDAIASWERDLKMLHEEYYVGKFGFGWPAS